MMRGKDPTGGERKLNSLVESIINATALLRPVVTQEKRVVRRDDEEGLLSEEQVAKTINRDRLRRCPQYRGGIKAFRSSPGGEREKLKIRLEGERGHARKVKTNPPRTRNVEQSHEKIWSQAREGARGSTPSTLPLLS